jgi:hypothetical protein
MLVLLAPHVTLAENSLDMDHPSAQSDGMVADSGGPSEEGHSDAPEILERKATPLPAAYRASIHRQDGHQTVSGIELCLACDLLFAPLTSRSP